MGKGRKIDGKSAASHKIFKEKAKSRVDDLQGLFTDLQMARNKNRASDVAVLEERVHQMLREWKGELDEPSPAPSLNLDSLGSFSSDLSRLLLWYEEEDDAISAFAQPAEPKPESDTKIFQAGDNLVVHEDYAVKQVAQEHKVERFPWYTDSLSQRQPFFMNKFEVSDQSENHQFHIHDEINCNLVTASDGSVWGGEDAIDQIYGIMPAIYPPPSAFLGPKCALWDCLRPAQGSGLCQDYCSSFHASVALNEGQLGITPVIRCGGIVLRDALLFSTLISKTQGKNVGIPECEGAATTKSPWNTPELFDLTITEGELMREWIFFDKPRRAFEGGNKKQRSLPDYSGRGWHESRKQIMKEFGGLKRSYYMDPQPLNNYEWHLYVYEANDSDTCALYRLELKHIDGKKSPKVKGGFDSLADLQKQMGRLTAVLEADDKQSVKVVAKFNSAGNLCVVPFQLAPSNGSSSYGAPQDHGYQEVDLCTGSGKQYSSMLNFDVPNEIDVHQLAVHEDFDYNIFSGSNDDRQRGEDVMSHFSGLQPSVCPSSLGPKCALWDCSRPALGLDWSQHYCSSFHGTLALNEGQPGAVPVQRPGGIGLKDGPLFAALSEKILGKDVGIPECEGAATNKSPWNAPELFDISILENEVLREWLFFDKPRRAFESGNRKQRSLPDYNGRGWHASRKQLMKEFGGVKRSYYMDPQPQNCFQWHLYEYSINSCDACTLYRLELKLINEEKSPGKKATNNLLSDLQKQLGRLTTDFPKNQEHYIKEGSLVNLKNGNGSVYSTPEQIATSDDGFGCDFDASSGLLVENWSNFQGA